MVWEIYGWISVLQIKVKIKDLHLYPNYLNGKQYRFIDWEQAEGDIYNKKEIKSKEKTIEK